jgi:uncharacterized protein
MQRVSWDDVMLLCEQLGERISSSGGRFDMLIGIARGGWVPTRLLSNSLNVKKIASIGMSYLDEGRKDLFTYSFPSPLGLGDRVLLVEDRLESGNAMKQASQMLRDKGLEVVTASIMVDKESIFRPDHYVLEVVDSVAFPWE